MIEPDEALKLKTELLCKGLLLDENLTAFYQKHGISPGRKGGAGPLGGRYFLLEDVRTLANVALWNNPRRTDLVLKEKKGDYFKIYDEQNQLYVGNLKLIENPRYYSTEFLTSDGIAMKKIALVHGVDCLATTIYQACKYWGCGDACKFCGIELSLQYDTTILEKTPQQLSEVVDVAKAEGRCSHMTLTSGTEEGEKGVNRYIDMLKHLKSKHPDIPLHVQIEPTEELNNIHALKEAGADTIGIHIEILDDFIRSIITPGKHKLPFELFEKNWKEAIEVFGKNQVASYILTGFGESSDDFINDLDSIVSIGVIPFITPVRSIPGVKDLPMTNFNILLEIYKSAAMLMKQYGVNPLENKAGCVRCGGCSAIKEAYKIA